MSKGPNKKTEPMRNALENYVREHPGLPYSTIRAKAAPDRTCQQTYRYLMQMVAEHRLQRVGSRYYPSDQNVEPFPARENVSNKSRKKRNI